MKMGLFVITVNGFQPLTIITKSSILDVAAVLDLPSKIVYVRLTELTVTTTWLPLSDFFFKNLMETKFLIYNEIICHTFEAKHLTNFSPH